MVNMVVSLSRDSSAMMGTSQSKSASNSKFSLPAAAAVLLLPPLLLLEPPESRWLARAEVPPAVPLRVAAPAAAKGSMMG